MTASSRPTSFRIDYEDRTYDFDMSAVTANEWKAVRAYCNLNPLDLFEAISDNGNIEAVEGLFWLVMRQNREPAFDMGQRQFKFFDFLRGWNKANTDFLKANQAADAAASESGDPLGSPTPV